MLGEATARAVIEYVRADAGGANECPEERQQAAAQLLLEIELTPEQILYLQSNGRRLAPSDR